MDCFKLFSLGLHQQSSALPLFAMIDQDNPTKSLNFLPREHLVYNWDSGTIGEISSKSLFGMDSKEIQYAPSNYWKLIYPSDKKPLKKILSRLSPVWIVDHSHQEILVNIWYRIIDTTHQIRPVMQQVSICENHRNLHIDLYDLSLFFQSQGPSPGHVRLEIFSDPKNILLTRITEGSDQHYWKKKLTRKENRIQDLVECGSSSKEIARAENISIHTVFTHRKNIRTKRNCFYGEMEK